MHYGTPTSDLKERILESFQILSSYSLPMITRQLHVCAPLISVDTGSAPHDPLVLVPMGKTIRVLNITDFQPREPPPFQLHDEMVEQAKRLSIADTKEKDDDDDNQNNDNEDPAIAEVIVLDAEERRICGT